MRNLFKFFIVILLFSCNKNEEPQEEVKNDCIGEYSTAGILVEIDEEIYIAKSQDTLVSAFLDLIMHYQVYYCVINKEAY